MRTALFALLAMGFLLLAGVLLFRRDLTGNISHGYSCAELPPREQVESVLETYNDDVDVLESIDEAVEVSVGSDCGDRADIVIRYGTVDQQARIRTFLFDETFHGVPVRLLNR